MKTLLLLGGMTPDVTMLYYQTINTAARSRLGDHSAAPLYLYSADLELMLQYASTGRWSEFSSVYADSVIALTTQGKKVDAVVICAILAHKVSRQLSVALEGTSVPILHIADMLADHLKMQHPRVKTLGLLGPKITMLDTDDADFFIGRLQGPDHGFEVIVPCTDEDMEKVNRGIIDEVAKGREAVTEATKKMFVGQAKNLVKRGAQAIVLGSTDLGFVLRQEDIGEGIPLIEPAAVHANAAAEWALLD